VGPRRSVNFINCADQKYSYYYIILLTSANYVSLSTARNTQEEEESLAAGARDTTGSGAAT